LRLQITSYSLNKYVIITTANFIYCSYRVEQAVMIPFQTAELSNESVIYKRLIFAIDIHRKGMESVIVVKHYNIGIININ